MSKLASSNLKVMWLDIVQLKLWILVHHLFALFQDVFLFQDVLVG